MSAITPPRVRRGDRIAVVVPAGPVRPERVPPALAALGDAFRLELSPSVLGPRHADTPSFLAGSDEVRAAELNAALRDPDVRAIVMMRGGYGAMRILPLLDAAALRADPKPIVGFSDGTALLSWAYAAGVRGIHGPVLAQLGDLPASDVERFVASLTDPAPFLIPVSRAMPVTRVHHDDARGPLIPANVTLASMLVGTPWALPFAGAIALFEEVGEKPYELDRYFTQLQLTRALEGLTAMVLGDLTRCYDQAPPVGVDPSDLALRTVLSHFTHVPVALGAPVGHGDRNVAVPFGGAAELIGDELRVAPCVA